MSQVTQPPIAYSLGDLLRTRSGPRSERGQASPGGLLRQRRSCWRGVLDDVFGLELLQLGGWGASRALLPASRTRRQTIVSDSPAAAPWTCSGDSRQLPVHSGSVDCRAAAAYA